MYLELEARTVRVQSKFTDRCPIGLGEAVYSISTLDLYSLYIL